MSTAPIQQIEQRLYQQRGRVKWVEELLPLGFIAALISIVVWPSVSIIVVLGGFIAFQLLLIALIITYIRRIMSHDLLELVFVSHLPDRAVFRGLVSVMVGRYGTGLAAAGVSWWLLVFGLWFNAHSRASTDVMCNLAGECPWALNLPSVPALLSYAALATVIAAIQVAILLAIALHAGLQRRNGFAWVRVGVLWLLSSAAQMAAVWGLASLLVESWDAGQATVLALVVGAMIVVVSVGAANWRRAWHHLWPSDFNR